MDTVIPLTERLLEASVASCSCMTKTPDARRHDPMCTARLHMESMLEIERLQHERKAIETALRAALDFSEISVGQTKARTTAS